MYTRQTFTKTERLCNKKLIDKLFSKGKSFFHHPFKMVYCKVSATDKFTGPFPVKVIISIPKRNFKKAVDRNRIKRLVKESYRRNKALLYNELDKHDKKLTVGIIYTDKHMPTFDLIEKKIIQVIHRLILNLKDHRI
jgi:ribonuclease P protein component